MNDYYCLPPKILSVHKWHKSGIVNEAFNLCYVLIM